MKIAVKILLAILLIVSYLGFSYYYFGGWWHSSLGTILIILFSYLLWKNNFLKVTGLKLSVLSAFKVLGLATIVTIASIYIIQYLGSQIGVSIVFTRFTNYYHDIFYILNEEIILGGIAIYLLLHKFKVSAMFAAVGLALIFSGMHFIFYKYIFQTGIIQLNTLAVIFFIGLIRNSLIIAYRHIGYSWALHFGWMVVMFGSNPYWIETNTQLSEPERFNIFLGSGEMLVLTAAIAIMSLVLLKRKYKADFGNIPDYEPKH